MTPPSPSPIFAPDWRRRFRRRLVAWYRAHARRLPWRESRDPYRVWVSEIMLQQTQVETVKPYFARFVAAFPTARDLAAADEQQVLRLWEGLGYYRRARQLHAAARVVAQEHGGALPRDFDSIRALPGVGRYTAGAIASIAFDARAPILEANTIRLFSRLLGYREDPRKSAGQRLLWRAAEEVLPRRETGVFNQALMELGSRVCAPRAPACDACPVATLCAARAANAQDEIPVASKRPKFEDAREAAVVVRHRCGVLLRRCGEDERWAGLWDFPRFAVERAKAASRGSACFTHPTELVAQVRRTTGVEIEPLDHLTTLRHGVTRFRITLECHTARYLSGYVRRDELRWVKPNELESYPLSATGRKLAALLK
jgi:A/G-specific adenine glycosylase